MTVLLGLSRHSKALRLAVSLLLIVGMLGACASSPPASPAATTDIAKAATVWQAPAVVKEVPPAEPVVAESKNLDTAAAVLVQAKSRWLAVPWNELPGFETDALPEAWVAWLRSCERPVAPWASLCADVRRLAQSDAVQQRAWMRERLQAFRVEPLNAAASGADGLLTAYFEPVLKASRQATGQHSVALWQPPANLAQTKPWFTREQIDTMPAAQAALRGREIAYLDDPVDALLLQIQGSGKLRVTEANGSQRLIRVSFAGSNDQPYRSVGRWLLDKGLIRDASWPGIKAWTAANPRMVQEMLWSNPRVVFFREEALEGAAALQGPRGAQNVTLTAGRSIAVDPGSIPLGAVVWMQSNGDALNVQRLVMAQDVGSAILGAVRADYFFGTGDAAGDIAGRVKQNLKLWVLWPK